MLRIMRGQFIKLRKWWFSPPHQGRFDILTMMGSECSRLDPRYQRHITFACTGCYQLYHHHRLRHYYPRPIADTNLPTPKGWISLVSKGRLYGHTFAQGYYTIESKGTGWNVTRLSGSRPTQYQWTNRAVRKGPRNYSLKVLGDREIETGTLCTSGQWSTIGPSRPLAVGKKKKETKRQ